MRKKIKQFALNSQHKTLLDYKTNYQQILLQEDKTTWMDYWEKMGRVGTWIDSVFVQVTAWYIGLDIKILVTTVKAENPFIIVTGSIDHIDESSDGPQLLLGNYSNVHYQSLLPLTMGLNIRKNPSARNFEEGTEDALSEETDDFIFMQNGNKVIFHCLKDNKLQCPYCSESFIRLVSHVTSNKCNISKSNIDIKEFTNQLNSFKEGFRLEMHRKRQQRSQANQRKSKGNDAMKEDQNKRKQKSQANLGKTKGNDAIKEDQNKRKQKRQANLIEAKGNEAMKEDQNNRKQRSRDKLNHERGTANVKEMQNKHKIKSQDKLRVEKGPLIQRKEQNVWEQESRKRKLDTDPKTLRINNK